MQEYLRDYADHPIPALDGKSPRQAANDPALRKKLLHLLEPVVRRIDERERLPSWMAGGPSETMNNLTSGSRQPVLLVALIAEMFEGATDAPEKMRPKPEAILYMIAIVKTVINELDRALRAR